MIRVVVLEPLAELELREAAAWYERETVGVGSMFADELELVFGAIAESTTNGLLVPGVRNDLPLRRGLRCAIPVRGSVRRADRHHSCERSCPFEAPTELLARSNKTSAHPLDFGRSRGSPRWDTRSCGPSRRGWECEPPTLLLALREDAREQPIEPKRGAHALELDEVQVVRAEKLEDVERRVRTSCVQLKHDEHVGIGDAELNAS